MRRLPVELSVPAQEDLDAVCAWIAADSPENAARWRRGICDAIERIGNFPRRFPVAYETRTLGFEVRLLAHGSYRVLFSIERERVLVLHVRHGARRRIGEEE